MQDTFIPESWDCPKAADLLDEFNQLNQDLLFRQSGVPASYLHSPDSINDIVLAEILTQGGRDSIAFSVEGGKYRYAGAKRIFAGSFVDVTTLKNYIDESIPFDGQYAPTSLGLLKGYLTDGKAFISTTLTLMEDHTNNKSLVSSTTIYINTSKGVVCIPMYGNINEYDNKTGLVSWSMEHVRYCLE
jgi:hypothetical protein